MAAAAAAAAAAALRAKQATAFEAEPPEQLAAEAGLAATEPEEAAAEDAPARASGAFPPPEKAATIRLRVGEPRARPPAGLVLQRQTMEVAVADRNDSSGA